MALQREPELESCTVCHRVASTRCPRCCRQLCRAHAPPVSDECCDPCEAEFRPFSVENLGIRVAMSTGGTLAGAAFGLLVAVAVGSLIFVQDPVRVRVLAMAAAMLGTVIGFGVGNVAAATLVRARFIDDRPSGVLPRARLLRRGRAAAGGPRTERGG